MVETNFFYTGHYPGERPLYKKPGGGYQPPYFNADYIGTNEFLNGVDLTNVPDWVAKNIKDDIKKSFNASILGGSISPEQLDQYGEEAVEDMPGAFGLSINLIDLATNPVETLTKFAKSSANKVIDWHDIENQRQVEIWQHILSDPKTVGEKMKEGIGDSSSPYYGMTEAAIDAMPATVVEGFYINGSQKISERHTSFVLNASRTGLVRNRANPLSLDGLGMEVEPGTVVNPYAEVRQKIIAFEQNSASAPFRESSFNTMMLTASNALKTDLNTQMRLVDGYKDARYGGMNLTLEQTLNMTNPAHKGTFKDLITMQFKEDSGYGKDYFKQAMAPGVGLLRVPAGRTEDEYASYLLKKHESFQARVELANVIGATSKDLGGKASISHHIEKYLLTGDGDALINDLSKGGFIKLDPTTGQIASVKMVANAQNARQKLHGFTTQINGQDVNIKGYVDRLDDSSRKHLNSVLSLYDKKLEEIIGLEDEVKKLVSASGAERAVIATRLRHKLGVIESGAPEIGSKFGALYPKGVVNRGITKSNLILGKSIHAVVLGDLRDEIKRDEDGLFNNLTVGGSIFRAILPRLENEREWGFVNELASALESGGVSRYFWLRAQDALGPYAPSYWIGKALKRYHYFGLVLTDELISNDKIKFGIGRAGFTVGGAGAPGRLFGNYFKEGVREGEIYRTGAAFKTITGRSFKMYGGSHFGFISSGGNLSDASLKRLLSMSESDLQSLFSTNVGNLRLTSMWARLNGGKVPYDATNLAEFEQFRDSLISYKRWLTKNKKMIGLTDADLADPEVMFEFFQMMVRRNVNPNTMAITRKYIGLLERLFEKLNLLQNKILQSRIGNIVYRKAFGGLGLLQKGIADSLKVVVTKVVSNLIVLLGGTLTGGVGAVVLKLVGPLVTYLVQKVTNGVIAVGAAVFKLDFSKLMDGFNKSFEKAMKWAMIMAGAPLLVILFIVTILFQGLSSGISPTNPSIVGGGGNGNAIVPSGGALPSCAEDTVTPSTCFYNSPTTILRYSYDYSAPSQDGGLGHGSNNYWDVMNVIMGVSDCGFAIPSAYGVSPFGPSGPGSANSYCGPPRVLSEFYGLAYDVQTSGSCGSVYLPRMADMAPGDTITWSTGTIAEPSFGALVELVGYVNGSPSPTYKLWLNHLAGGTVTPGVNMPAGTRIAETYAWPGDNDHIHAELFTLQGADWLPVRPELYVCP